MKTDQRLTPKYWVAHDTTTDDVYLDTASKSAHSCREKLSKLLYNDVDFMEEKMEKGILKVSLIELKIVEL